MKQHLLFAFIWGGSLLLAMGASLSQAAAAGRPAPHPAAMQLTSLLLRQPVTQGDERGMVVYPNPSTGIVHLTISGFEGRKVEISVLNVIGTVLYRETLTDLSERATRTLDLNHFANGLYYVKLEADNTSQLCKLVIR